MNFVALDLNSWDLNNNINGFLNHSGNNTKIFFPFSFFSSTAQTLISHTLWRASGCFFIVFYIDCIFNNYSAKTRRMSLNTADTEATGVQKKISRQFPFVICLRDSHKKALHSQSVLKPKLKQSVKVVWSRSKIGIHWPFSSAVCFPDLELPTIFLALL